MIRSAFLCAFCLLLGCQPSKDQGRSTASITSVVESSAPRNVSPGAAQLPIYVPLLKGKRCGVVVNQSSVVDREHLVDTLFALDVNVTKIFVPEHGFRGTADAGAKIEDERDEKLDRPIFSLYGQNKKPTPSQMEDLDIMIFDLQDVGVRCYTYISTLHYVMEACAENGVPLIVLDRPNPNGHFIDGPVRDEKFKSFIAMHPVPFVYGMTIGEYARMIKGEGWIAEAEALDLQIVQCHGYNHDTRYVLPVAPSPNLRSERSVMLYPSLVFFEGTIVSVGRGTPHPFEVYGHPSFGMGSFTFTPESQQGASRPKLQGQTCYGQSFTSMDPYQIRAWGEINLDFLIVTYNFLSGKEDFFLDNGFFDKLAGNEQLRKAIESGKTVEEIRKSWIEDLRAFKEIRREYLIYSDES